MTTGTRKNARTTIYSHFNQQRKTEHVHSPEDQRRSIHF